MWGKGADAEVLLGAGNPLPSLAGLPYRSECSLRFTTRRLPFRGHWLALGAQQVREGLRSEPSSDPEATTTESSVIVSTSW